MNIKHLFNILFFLVSFFAKGQAVAYFAPVSNSPFAVGAYPYSIISADFNGDGKVDLATANDSSENVSVLLGNGDGSFIPSPNSPYKVGASPLSVISVDFNNDGKADIATANNSSDNVSVLLGNGAGSFTPAANSPFKVGSATYAVASGDFNGDSNVDLVATNPGYLYCWEMALVLL